MRTFRAYLEEKVAAFNMTRVSMPQIKDQKKFKAYLNALGINFWIGRLSVDLLNPIQMDIDQDKVASIDPTQPADPIIVSDSNYILDGHHRYYAHVLNDVDDMEVLQVDKGINQLLVTANDFVEMEDGGGDD